MAEDKRFIAKKEISVRAMLTMLSEALSLPALSEDTQTRNVEFEATLPDVRIDCLLFLTNAQAGHAQSGALKELGTLNVLHIKAIGDRFTLEHLQTYLGEALILNSSTQTKPADQIVLLTSRVYTTGFFVLRHHGAIWYDIRHIVRSQLW